MLKKIKKHAITIIIIFAFLIINVLAYYQYSKNVSEQLKAQLDAHIQAIIDETVECLNIKMDEQISTYKAVATFISNLVDVENDDIMEALRRQANAAGYSDFEIINPEGKGINNDEITDYQDNTSFKKALAGKSIMETYTDEFGNIKGINYYIPMMRAKNIIGVLKVSSSLAQFTASMDLSELGKYGNVFVVKQDGTLLSRGYDLEEVENITMLLGNDKSVSKLINSMQSRKSGYIAYNVGNTKRYLCYSKTDYNKWYMVSIVQASALDLGSENITSEGNVFFIEIAILTTLLLVYLIRMVRFESNDKKISKTQYNIISEYTNSIVIEYDCNTDTAECNDKWEKIFGYEFPKENIYDSLLEHIAKRDATIFKTEIDNVLKNGDFKSFSLFVSDIDGEEIECAVKLTAIKGKKGKIQKVLGVVEV